jgi:hypothetical protein
MSPAKRANPDLTNAAGLFGWDVLTGFYRVRAERDGCHAPGDPTQAFVETPVLQIPPPALELRLVLDCGVAATPGSLALDGSGGYAEATGADLNLLGDWTVEAWFKDETAGGYNHGFTKLLGKVDPDKNGEGAYFITVGYNTIKAGVRHNWRYYAVDANIRGLTPGWHHVAVSLLASTRTLTIYLDGTQIAQDVLDTLSTGNDLPLSIGRFGTTGGYWNGKIDDVRIWSLVRSSSQIAASFATELTGAPSGLVANWRFNDGPDSNTAVDSAGGHTAALFGGAIMAGDHP